MEFNKPVSNPMLAGSIQLVKAEDTPEHRNMFISELIKAHFLMPANITPEPEKTEDGRLRLLPESQIQFPMLENDKGEHFFMAFTSKREFDKWMENEDKAAFTLTFADYAGLLFNRNKNGETSSAIGFVINPKGDNILIPKGMVGGIMAAKQMQGGRPVPPKPEQ